MGLETLINNDLNLETAPDGRPLKALTWEQAITGACALFELNVAPADMQDMAARAALPYGDAHPAETATLRREWFGFVHAGIIYALMGKAPRRAIEGYIAQTRALLARFGGYDEAAATAFIDTTLNGYVELLLAGEQRRTPHRLLGLVAGERYLETLSKDQVAFISGMMAITLCNILDTLERYTFLPDPDEQAR